MIKPIGFIVSRNFIQHKYATYAEENFSFQKAESG